MGTINYKTSDYITIGYNCDWDSGDFESWEEMENEKVFDIENTFSEVNHILEKYNFYYYQVKLDPGYYEGFSIDIECNFGIAWDSWEDKREAQKEITQIKAFLTECIENGLCVVHPGWCTAYLNYSDSLQELKEAIAEMRLEAKTIPTWNQYERSAK